MPRVGSREFPISRVGSGRIKNVSKLTGRVFSDQELFISDESDQVGSGQSNFQISGGGSSQEAMKSSQIESGNDPRETGHTRVGPA